ncbi:MAG TPA: alcohol dehydrogenase catalytic domain-containing protein [Spirochaetota bacterium]|nr:alcohol dehydrogenase catalytic domain-containing protein [Spirochaetota bacterium]
MQALVFNVTVSRFIAAKVCGFLFGKKSFYRGPARTVRLADVPEPVIPSPDWAKIRTIQCGYCGSDLNLMLLHDSPTSSPFTSFPCVTGHEIVGEIEETGKGVKGLSRGDRVTIMPILGCETRGISPQCRPCREGRYSNCENFAEGKLPPGMFIGINSGVNGGFAPALVAHKSQIFRVPDKLSNDSAVMTEPVAVALQAVFDNMPQKGEKVLVIGGGVIGNLIVQSIRALATGCRISVIEPSTFASELCRAAGADDVFSPGEIFDKTSEITGAKFYTPLLGMDIPMGGFNRIYDTVGNSDTMNVGLRILAAMGTLSMVGIAGDIKLDMTPLWLKLQKIQGVFSYGTARYNGKQRHVFDIALELMVKKKINAAQLVTHHFSLDDYCTMIETNLNKSVHRAVKTVVSFEDQYLKRQGE